MKHSYLFLADGFEEIEALAAADILRRAGIKTILVSIKDTPEVTGANAIKVIADTVIADVELTPDTEWLIMPGGMPGATNLAACSKLTAMIKEQFSRGGRIASICASPGVVLGPLGVLLWESLSAKRPPAIPDLNHTLRMPTSPEIPWRCSTPL